MYFCVDIICSFALDVGVQSASLAFEHSFHIIENVHMVEKYCDIIEKDLGTEMRKDLNSPLTPTVTLVHVIHLFQPVL